MNTYLLIKTLHILSSVALFGIGFGSAYYLFFINRTRNVAAIAEVARLVVRADFWFTTPTIVIQPLSGYALATMSGYSLTDTWLLSSYALFAFAGICWLPVVWMQIKMADMAKIAAEKNAELPQHYWRYARIWERLGILAFPSILIIYGLMVFKPNL